MKSHNSPPAPDPDRPRNGASPAVPVFHTVFHNVFHTTDLSDSARAVLAEVARVTHLLRGLREVRLDLAAEPGIAFPLVKVAEAERVLQGLLVHLALGAGKGAERVAPQVIQIGASMRRRLLQALPAGLRQRVLPLLDGPAPTEEEVWAVTFDRFGVDGCEALAGAAIPLDDRKAHAIAKRLLEDAPGPGAWVARLG